MKQSSTTESSLDLKKPFDATNIKGQRDKFPKSKRILSQFPEESKTSNENLMEAVVGLVALTGVVLFLCVITLIRDYRNEKELPEVEPIPIVQESVSVIEAKTELPEEKTPIFTDEEIIAMVVHAEAQGEPMIGKVAVACVVYNRCDRYGLTVESVVNAKNQFAISDSYTEEDLRAVEIARDNRDLYPENMLYFRADAYHTFGSRWQHIGNHYFSLESEDN